MKTNELKKIARVAAVHDMCGFGKCSLATALPIISACGIETSVLPTAVLSTHTGGFENFTYRDLTSDMIPVFEHWKKLGLTFDAVYTGFLGSIEQIEIVKKIIEYYRLRKGLAVVDPVMADNGKLYKIFPASFPREMLKMCAVADILVPNITEACFLTNEEYREGPYSKKYIQNLIDKLLATGAKQVVLTGVYLKEGRLGAACSDGKTTEYYFTQKIEGYYHGTGDVFASALTGGILNGKTLAESTAIAAEYVVACIKTTQKEGRDIKYGVNFEENIPKLIKSIK